MKKSKSVDEEIEARFASIARSEENEDAKVLSWLRAHSDTIWTAQEIQQKLKLDWSAVLSIFYRLQGSGCISIRTPLEPHYKIYLKCRPR